MHARTSLWLFHASTALCRNIIEKKSMEIQSRHSELSGYSLLRRLNRTRILKCLLYGIVGCPLLRGFECIEVYGNIIQTFKIVRYRSARNKYVLLINAKNASC